MVPGNWSHLLNIPLNYRKLGGIIMGKIKDELGHKYGRLTVVAYAGKSKYGAMWHCVCDCGNELDVCGAYLRSHNTMSCGCL